MHDVIIIGAGLAGSSLATVLSSLGWDVLLVERHRWPEHKVCGEFLSPEAQASLQAMGLYSAVAALKPAVLEHARLVSPLGVRLRVNLPDTAWGISRFALDTVLAQAAVQTGVTLSVGVTATAITKHQQGYCVDLLTPSGPTRVQSRIAILACGRHSQPSLRPEAHAYGERPVFIGLRCHYEGISMPAQIELFLFDGGYAGLCPTEQGRFNLCMLVSREAFARGGGGVRLMLEAAPEWNPALKQRLEGSRALPQTEVTVAPVDIGRPACPWNICARLGDSAVMLPPLCSDGMAMALRSAEICASLVHDTLRGQLSTAAWEAAYPKAWYAEFNHTLHVGRQIQAALGVSILSDVLLSLGNVIPFVANSLVRATRGRIRPVDQVKSLVNST